MSDLEQATRALSPAELQSITSHLAGYAQAMADRGFPRVAAYYHAAAVQLAEESDRRDEIVDALDPDRDEIGAIVPEPGEGGSNV